MAKIRYIEIQNFKTFGDNVHIDLSHPAVLIGPNNSGKTSVIQALALWSRGVRVWLEKKGGAEINTQERTNVGINRLDIFEVPVNESRFFWHNARVLQGNKKIPLIINVGVEVSGTCYDCRFIFTWRDDEVIYCTPCEETRKNTNLIQNAATIQLNLLYPMSGIELEEPLVQEGWINVRMGQGQTAQVLRNLCFKVYETNRNDWLEIDKLFIRLFNCKLKPPAATARGTIILKYSQHEIEQELDISLAGRGQLQMLLILAYLYSHKNSVLMIDEPDAHLEILRQKQMYEVLKEVARRNCSQVVIVTHSEVILDDAAENNLTMILNGEAINIANRQEIRTALRHIAIEHYYRARINPRLLYIEGSTDLAILRAIAEKLHHPAFNILMEPINCYYVRHNQPEDNLDHRLDVVGGQYPENIKQHFYALKRCITSCKGFAIIDSDQRIRKEEVSDDLAILYWQDYEIENTFITPSTLIDFIKARLDAEGSLFGPVMLDQFKDILHAHLLRDIFQGQASQLEEFQKASLPFQRTVLRNVKMSQFAESVFSELAQITKQPILLRKSEFYQLIDFVDAGTFGEDVRRKLDMLVKFLRTEGA